jgi:tellurite methyltransferase
VTTHVLRPITGFHQDAHGDWVAQLSCGHNQHVRHHPPFWSRPWVTTESGRAEKLGQPLPCVLCERFEMPADLVAYRRTGELSAQTTPAALRANHTTKAGVWALIHVLEGTLRYIVEPPLERDTLVASSKPGVIVPEIPHRVEPDSDCRFFVELYRKQP